MSSAKTIAANRNNGRKSRGPTSAAGKAKASRNALRHGLNTINRNNPACAQDIEMIAKKLCGCDSDPELFEHAVTMAESDLLLRCVQAERVALVDRLREFRAVPISTHRPIKVLGEAMMNDMETAVAELIILTGRDMSGTEQKRRRAYLLRKHGGRSPVWRDAFLIERDENHALLAALPDLERIRRYEQRAWSCYKRAVANFIQHLTKTRGDRDDLRGLACRRGQAENCDPHAI